ncbi:hypothetical protein [Psychromonas sp. SP041]|uniref:hypothetical protein n=1 Tax=Psychromonas sp. SP041 TaxID=1365007 RepID=UPI0004180140|nr:hypothetical protein [Psychromonas sp. SP041]
MKQVAPVYLETITLTDAINSNPGNALVTKQQVHAFIESLSNEKSTNSITLERLIMETKFNDPMAVKSEHVLGETPFTFH